MVRFTQFQKSKNIYYVMKQAMLLHKMHQCERYFTLQQVSGCLKKIKKSDQWPIL